VPLARPGCWPGVEVPSCVLRLKHAEVSSLRCGLRVSDIGGWTCSSLALGHGRHPFGVRLRNPRIR
jgi:hypothetical protein